MLTAIMRTTTGVTIQPRIVPNKTNNTITVRATGAGGGGHSRAGHQPTTSRAPRSRSTCEILEVSRARTKELGLNLSRTDSAAIFSPERAAAHAAADDRLRCHSTSTRFAGRQHRRLLPDGAAGDRQVPARATSTPRCSPRRSCAARKAQKLTLKLGDDVPYLTHVVHAHRGRRRRRQPAVVLTLSHRRHQRRGDAAPRHLRRRHPARPDRSRTTRVGPDATSSADSSCRRSPSRKVTTKLRLRDGESNLLAGLLQDDERRSMTGFPGDHAAARPEELFSAYDDTIAQTGHRDAADAAHHPHARVHGQRDLSPIYVGTNQNFGLTGPPPLIAPPPAEPEPAPGATPAPGTAPAVCAGRRTRT